ncbi:hypothetical protein Tco_0638361 [Tanacetum coccineum]
MVLELTIEAIKDSESYKEYYAIASGAEPLITKASVKKKQVGSDKTKTPPTAKGKRLKTSTKAAKPAKKKQPAKTSKAKGLTVLSEVALIEAEQMKLATKRSLIQTHSSHASGSSANEGTGGKPGVPDVPTYGSDDEQISWKSSDEKDDDEVGMNDDDDNDDYDDDDDDNQDDDGQDDDGQDDDGQDDDGQEYDDQDDEGPYDVNELTESDNDGDDFVHPKFLTNDQEDRHNEEDIQEEGLDLRMDEEETNEDEEVDELYRDVMLIWMEEILNDRCSTPEGQQQSSFMSSGFVSNMLNPSPDTAANLSELELKKILIDKMERNKSIHRSDEQKNLYKALDDDEEPSAGSNRGSKRRRAGKEPESTSVPKEKTSKSSGKSKEGSKSHHTSTGKSAQVEEPIHADEDLEELAH